MQKPYPYESRIWDARAPKRWKPSLPYGKKKAILLGIMKIERTKLSRRAKGAAYSRPQIATRPAVRPLPTIGTYVQKIAQPLCRQYGFADARFMTHWWDIIGTNWARHCLPERLSYSGSRGGGATLTVRVDGPFALELQHTAPQILERINAFLGHKAVTQLKIVQGPLPKREGRRKPAQTPSHQRTSDQDRAVEEGISKIQHEGLRQALSTLARNLHQPRS